MNLTKLVLKRPVSTALIVLGIIVFGIFSIPGFDMELIPDIDLPMYIIYTVYPGASPTSIDELVTSKIEDSAETLSGVDSVLSYSYNDYSMVALSYDYDQNMNDAYTSLSAALDTLADRYVAGEDVTITDVEQAISNYAAEHPKSICIGSLSGYQEVYLTGPWPTTITLSASAGDSTVIIIVAENGTSTTYNPDGTTVVVQGSGTNTNPTNGTDDGSSTGSGTGGSNSGNSGGGSDDGGEGLG